MTSVDRPVPVDRALLRRAPALSRHLVVALATAAVVSVVLIVQAQALAAALSDLQAGEGPDTSDAVASLVAILCIVALVRAVAAGTTEASAAWAMRSTRRTLRTTVLDHAEVDADPDDPGIAARRATAVSSGLDELEPYVRQYLPSLASAAVIPLVAGLRILGADLLSAVIVAVTVPLIPVFMILIGVVTEQRTQRKWGMMQRLAGHFLDVLEGIPTLRLFGRITSSTRAVREVADRYRTVTMGTLRIAFLSALALELLATLSVAIVAVSVGLRLASGSLNLETALVVLLLAPECYLPLRRVGAAFHQAQAGADASTEIGELLGRPIVPTGDAVPTPGRLVVRGVTVERPGRAGTAEPLDLDLAPGDLVAVVGPSGTGKSTALDVIRGRVVPSRGSVTLDGVPVGDLDARAWSDLITLIPQQSVAVGRDVEDAVRAATRADPDSVAAALHEVGLDGFGEADPSRLSGGQARRVDIARTIVAVRDGTARVVLADEPTAHLDDATAHEIRRVLRSLADEGAGVLVATHDPALAAVATRVVELPGTTPGLRHVPEPGVQVPGERPERARPAPGEAPAAVPQPGGSPWRALARVVGFGRPVWRGLTGAFGLGALAEMCTVGLAGVSAWLILRAGQQPALADLTLAVTGVRAFGVGKGAFRYAERLATHDAALRVIGGIRSTLVQHLGRIAPGGIAGWSRGSVVHRVVADVDRLVDLFARILVPAASILAASGVACLIAVIIDPAAGLLLTAGVVVVGIVLPALAAVLEVRTAVALGARRGDLAGAVLDHCEHVDTLVAHRLVDRQRDTIAEIADALDDTERSLTRRRIAWTSGAAAGPVLATAAVAAAVIAGGDGPVPPAIGMLILWPLTVVELVAQLIEPASSVPSIAAAAERTTGLLDIEAPPEPDDPIEPPDPPVPVVLDGVVARWPGQAQDVLAGLDLVIDRGERVVLTGPSGVGKSTVAAVLVRFLIPAGGRYRLGGVDTDRMTGDGVRTQVSWIEQRPWLADSTVRQNLLLADPSADDGRLHDVLGTVGLGAWLAATDDGLDTHVGTGGRALSGGEAQRLALARVLLAGQSVVVLDEPTAHLDEEMADRVLHDVVDRMGDRSVLVISHGRTVRGARLVAL